MAAETDRPVAHQTVMVSVVPTNCVGKVRRDLVAGPLRTCPAVLYCEPWHGQTYVGLRKPVIVHASCVQMAVSAVKDVLGGVRDQEVADRRTHQRGPAHWRQRRAFDAYRDRASADRAVDHRERRRRRRRRRRRGRRNFRRRRSSAAPTPARPRWPHDRLRHRTHVEIAGRAGPSRRSRQGSPGAGVASPVPEEGDVQEPCLSKGNHSKRLRRLSWIVGGLRRSARTECPTSGTAAGCSQEIRRSRRLTGDQEIRDHLAQSFEIRRPERAHRMITGDQGELTQETSWMLLARRSTRQIALPRMLLD